MVIYLQRLKEFLIQGEAIPDIGYRISHQLDCTSICISLYRIPTNNHITVQCTTDKLGFREPYPLFSPPEPFSDQGAATGLVDALDAATLEISQDDRATQKRRPPIPFFSFIFCQQELLNGPRLIRFDLNSICAITVKSNSVFSSYKIASCFVRKNLSCIHF